MSTSTKPAHAANDDVKGAVQKPETDAKKALDDKSLDEVAGGLNPQPLPPITRVHT